MFVILGLVVLLSALLYFHAYREGLGVAEQTGDLRYLQLKYDGATDAFANLDSTDTHLDELESKISELDTQTQMWSQTDTVNRTMGFKKK